jgi:hypothetical protein
MPGFSVTGNETGANNGAGNVPQATAEFRRKHRWRIQTGLALTKGDDWTYLQKAQRPHFKYDEPVVHHNEEEAWFAGKRHWEPINFTFYDKVGSAAQGAGGSSDISADIQAWLGGTSQFPVGDWNNANTSLPSVYKQPITMQMLAGDGTADETWTLLNAWAKEANFNELDYTNTEIQTLTVIVRYDRASVTHP